MARFVTRLHSDSPPEAAFAGVLDLGAQSEVIPFTRVTSTDGRPLHQGSEFLGVTGFGPLSFDDRMRVERFVPPDGAAPGHARIVKTGAVVTGWIDLHVTPSGSGAEVTWIQEIGITGLPRLASPAVAAGARLGYGWALRRLLARAG